MMLTTEPIDTKKRAKKWVHKEEVTSSMPPEVPPGGTKEQGTMRVPLPSTEAKSPRQPKQVKMAVTPKEADEAKAQERAPALGTSVWPGVGG